MNWPDVPVMGHLEILYRTALDVIHLEGAVAEVGVFRGETSYRLKELMPAKEFHLYDTFTGFPDDVQDGPYTTDQSLKKGEFGDCPLEEVQRRFEGFGGVYFHAGTFPETVGWEASGAFCLAYLDADTYLPTIHGFHIFYPQLVPGGKILVHDHGNPRCPGIAPACEEFMAQHPEAIGRVLKCDTGFDFYLVEKPA